jgi:hypothetical protein
MTSQGHQGATGTVAEDEHASRATPLAGFEYQIDVSVWLALDLILVSRQTREVVLEPASQEDLEAELSGQEPGRLVSLVPMADYTLVVQAKRREGNAWTPKTLKSLLEYGSTIRPSASTRLADPRCRYLLVTSAGLNGDAQKLGRRRPGMWPGPDTLPQLIAKGLNHDITGRFAVIANQDDERLRVDIDRLLRESCRVPNARLEACLIQLREAARARIVRAGGGRLERQELEDIIRRHDGYLASSPELEHYVYPTNWSDLRAQMAQKSAAILVGQSGTGKTLATQMLYDELRKVHPGLTRVLIRQGPSQLRDDTTPAPVLYDIEDPWGRFDFDQNSRAWNDQLGRFFASARTDRMIIATSRRDVALASGSLDTIKNWEIKLEAEHYGSDQRHRLYTTRVDSLPQAQQKLTRLSETQVLGELATPLEIQKFFDAIRALDPEDFHSDFFIVNEAIRRAHQNSIEQTVIEQIEARGDIDAAAILWALLGTGDQVTRSILLVVEDGLCDMDEKNSANVSSLVDCFVAARNFRQNEAGDLTYYHPRVEAGITRALEKNRRQVRQALRRLIDFLVLCKRPTIEWGVATAALILERVGTSFAIEPGEAVQARIDAWLEARLMEGGKEFEQYLKCAANVGSSASNAAEVARFLLTRAPTAYAGRDEWEALMRPAEWYRARAVSMSTKPLLETFIRTLLPIDFASYPANFAQELSKFVHGLESAFMDAARAVVQAGDLFSHDAIAYGALQDFDGFEEIVDLAVSFLTPTEDDLRKRAMDYLDVVNCVYDEEHEFVLHDNDQGQAARQFLEAYVNVARAKRNWECLARHRHIKWLRHHWLWSFSRDVRLHSLDDDELAAAFAVGYGTEEEEYLWLALLSDWKEQYSVALHTRLREGASTFAVDSSALACVLRNDQQGWRELLAYLRQERNVERFVNIGRGLAHLHCDETQKGQNALAEAARMQLPAPFNEICAAEIELKKEKRVVLSQTALQTLQGIENADALIRSLRLQLDAHCPLFIEPDVCWALETSYDFDTVVNAVSAAIRHGMASYVNAALKNQFAHAVAMALGAIASSLVGPLPAYLLDLANHRGSPVRLTLAEALCANVHPSYQQTLIKLAKDQWCQSDLYPNSEYPIARVAIAGLIELGGVEYRDGLELWSKAILSSDDEVIAGIFRVLANSGANLQRMLFDWAMTPDTGRSQSAAIVALLDSRESIDQRLIEEFSADQIATCHALGAGLLAVLLGERGSVVSVQRIAKDLAINRARSSLLFLVAGVLNKRDPVVAREIVQWVTSDPEVLDWALSCTTTTIDEARIAEFGEPEIISQIRRYKTRLSN